MARLCAVLMVFGMLSACGGTADMLLASDPVAVGAPSPTNAADEGDGAADEEDGAADKEDGDEATDHLATLGGLLAEAMRGLLAEAKREMEREEWLAFLKKIGITEHVARTLIVLTDNERIKLTSSTSQMPVVDLDATVNRYKRTLTGIRHIGPDVAPLPAGTRCDMSGENPIASARWCDDPLPNHALPRVADHDGVEVSHGRVRDGVGREKVVEWLKLHAIAAQEWIRDGFSGLATPANPRTLRIVEGASKEQVGWVVEATRIINAALPHEWKIAISDDPGSLTPMWPVPEGEIHIRFDSASNNTYWVGADRSEDGTRVHRGGTIWMNPDIAPRGRMVLNQADDIDREQTALGLLVHEILHAMGFLAHPEMVSSLSYNNDLADYGGLPAHVIYPLDREGLLAAYTRLEPGVAPEDIDDNLGPWSDTSTHIRGVLGLPGDAEMAFGAAHRNGFTQPWAYGPSPDMDLADNTALSGNASWAGRLLGLTPEAEVVAGAVDMTVPLATLDGTLDFTALESWAANAAPEGIGTGTMWGDGDLGYTIAVSGNTFIQTGGDEGIVTGAFFGAAHEAMGGTLERDDLAAGFGGTR